MPIPISCEYCDVSYQITDRAAGKTVRCKDCGEPIDVPAPRRASGPSRQARSRGESRSGQRAESRSRTDRGARSSRDDGGDRDRYIRNRRERQRTDEGHARNIIIGVACGAVALLGGGLFLVFGGGDDDGGTDGGDPSSAAVSGDNGNAPAGGGFETRLTRRGPAPGGADPVPSRSGVKAIQYVSEGRSLKAWMMEPGGAGPYPALVYFHGGFSFGLADLDACRPFLNEGFVVLAPSFRGENGNPGEFELMAGEVDDAVAAARWLASQGKVDGSRMFAFGHSVGGGISALVSLRADAPFVHCGGAGGMYDESTFREWSDIAPFDYNDSNENRMRVLKGRESQMVREYYGYYGTTDFGIAGVARSMQTSGTKLKVLPIPGDHFTSLSTAMARYLQVVKQSLPGGSESGQTAPPSVAFNPHSGSDRD